jgi:hypothetical protein
MNEMKNIALFAGTDSYDRGADFEDFLPMRFETVDDAITYVMTRMSIENPRIEWCQIANLSTCEILVDGEWLETYERKRVDGKQIRERKSHWILYTDPNTAASFLFSFRLSH